MFTTFIVQPIFNLLVLIYALLPGHNFGMAIIIFTIIVRLLMWPLVKKQLHHAKAMRALQPEIKKIKKAAKGDRQAESRMLMELYKERAINPFSSLGVLIIQIPILLGLYSGLTKVLNNKQQIIEFSYTTLHHLPWMQALIKDIGKFDNTLLGFVDLTRKAIGPGGIYWPAMIIVLLSAVAQYYQSKQLMPTDKDARSLRSILRDAGKGSSADQSEVSAAVGQGTVYLVPLFVLFISIGLPAALPLYWLVSSLVAIVQQTIILREDETEMEVAADKLVPDAKTVKAKVTTKPIIKGSTVTKVTQSSDETADTALEGEVIAPPPKPKSKAKSSKSAKKRRRKK